MASPRYGLPYIAGDQAQKHVTHNAALDMVDALLPGLVVSATVTAAPSAPVEGAAYIVPPAGVFGTVPAGSIAVWAAGTWREASPEIGWRVLVADEGAPRVYAGAGVWRPGSALGPSYGSAAGLAIREAEVSLSGATSSALALLPARAIVLSVTAWNAAAVTGAASYAVGISGSPALFGSSLSPSAGASNVGVVAPFPTYAPADVILTAGGGSFSGGRVRLSAALLVPLPGT